MCYNRRMAAAGVRIAILSLIATVAAGCSPSAPPPVEPDWDRVVERGKHRAFRRLQQSLAEGTISAKALPAFDLVLSGEPLERARGLVHDLDDPAQPQAATRLSLHRELMLAPSDPDILYDACAFEIERTFRNAERDEMNYGALFSWGSSWPAYAALVGYEATGQARFVELVADAFERMLPLRDSELGRRDKVRNRVMPSWGSQRYDKQGRYTNEVTTAGRVVYPVAKLVLFVRNDETLVARLGQRVEAYVPTLSEILSAFDDDFRYADSPIGEEGWYISPATGQVEALNHMAWVGNAHLLLHELTGNTEHRRKAEAIARYFRNCMRLDRDGCLVWEYMPQPDRRFGGVKEATWKACVTFHLPWEFASRGVVFTEDDMRAITRTILTHVYLGEDWAKPGGRWNAYIDGTPRDLDGEDDSGFSHLSATSFILLDRYDPKIRTVIEELVASRPGLGGWLNRTYALIAYAHRLKPVEP